MWSLLLTLAWAGYGDARDGMPTATDRLLHVWTDAARVAPRAFTAAYGEGGCSFGDFTPTEKSPQAPLAWSMELGEAARFHSRDMERTGHFDHTSSDGTPMPDRVNRFYHGFGIGENIIYNYPTVRDAVLSGWMCSTGHRRNIMDPEWDEFGGAFVGVYGTQNFGVGHRDRPVITMGTHSPVEPGGAVTFYADIGGGSAPSEVVVVLDGEARPMDLLYGEAGQGVYKADLKNDGTCHLYWFEATLDSGEVARFPGDGAYGYGPCEFDDPVAGWTSVHTLREPGGLLEDEPEEKGCDHGRVGGGFGLVMLAALARRRR